MGWLKDTFKKVKKVAKGFALNALVNNPATMINRAIKGERIVDNPSDYEFKEAFNEYVEGGIVGLGIITGAAGASEAIKGTGAGQGMIIPRELIDGLTPNDFVNPSQQPQNPNQPQIIDPNQLDNNTDTTDRNVLLAIGSWGLILVFVIVLIIKAQK